MKVVIDIDDMAYKFVQNTSFVEDESTMFEQTNADREKTLFLFDILYAIKNGVPVDTCGDCISRQAAIDVVEKWFNKIQLNGDICCDGIRSLPSVEPERKTGKWHVEGFEAWCTNCGFHPATIEAFDYCPSCGSKMEVNDVSMVESDTGQV